MSVVARGFGWRWNGRQAWAVRGLDLEVADGERVLLLGPSGAGKSTLLTAVAGVLDGSDGGTGDVEGTLEVDGVDAHAARLAALEGSAGHARSGLLLQDPQAQTVLARCGDDVAFGLENHCVPREDIWPRVDVALDQVGLPVDRARPTAHLSGGQRQRLALAGVLALRPATLLLDEPTAMLDPGGAARLAEVVDERLRATGAGCLVVEHRVSLWLDVVDRVVVLDRGGGVAADGAPREVIAARGEDLAAAGVWVPGLTPRALRTPGATHSAGSAPAPAAPAPATPAPAAPADGPVIMGDHPLSEPGKGGSPMITGRGAAGRGGSAMITAGARRDPAPGRDGQVLLTLAGVSAGHRSGGDVLTGVDVSVRAGRGVAVRGPNGAGKSTLALVIAGLTAPSAGTVTAGPALRSLVDDGAGSQPVRWRPRQLVARIGSVFQDPRHQFVARTVADELAVGPRRLGLGEDGPDGVVARVEELLEHLRLARLARANPFTLSGGEQRRLSVGTALATRPAVLVLDEPTFGQDAATWAELAELLRGAIAGGTAVVAATHDDDLTAAIADETWHVDGGRLTVASAPGASSAPTAPSVASPQDAP